MAIYPKFTGVPYKESPTPKEKTLGTFISNLWEEKKKGYLKDCPEEDNQYALSLHCVKSYFFDFLPHNLRLEPTEELQNAYRSLIDQHFTMLREKVEDRREEKRKVHEEKLKIVRPLVESSDSGIAMMGKLLLSFIDLPFEKRNRINLDVGEYLKLHMAEIGLETYLLILEKVLRESDRF